jgi:phage terminase large subunit-like protein
LFVDETIMPIPKKKVIECQRKFTDEEVKDLPCYIGVDLSEVNDLTSVNLLWDGGDILYSKSYFFFVNSGNNALRKGKIDINKWVEDKHVIKCGTQIIDTKLIKQYLFEFSTQYNVKGLYYDPYHFKPFLILPQGEKNGWLIPEDINQNSILCTPVAGWTKFHWPYRFLESKIHANSIVLYPNPCLVWNFTNIILEEDRHSNILVRKNEHLDPIDGIIGLLNSIYGYMGIADDKVARFYR